MSDVKIKMKSERQRYNVQAHDDRFAIMTKPMNAQKTYLYTITDLVDGIRGPTDLIFGLDYDVDTPTGAARLLQSLQSGEVGLSSVRRKSKELEPCEVVQLRGLST